ncbi:hypothetical protein HDV02_006721 [Globomyces sp. JEL0801]|nr:hypothetical protein HDV02_006721 [Globomyces sp. JEL0801]
MLIFDLLILSIGANAATYGSPPINMNSDFCFPKGDSRADRNPSHCSYGGKGGNGRENRHDRDNTSDRRIFCWPKTDSRAKNNPRECARYQDHDENRYYGDVFCFADSDVRSKRNPPECDRKYNRRCRNWLWGCTLDDYRRYCTEDGYYWDDDRHDCR